MMILTKNEEYCFIEIAEIIYKDEKYKRLLNYVQHGNITTYEHCISVAKVSFWINRRMNLNCDEKELVVAALLHDYYLYDWHTKGDYLHGYHHPSIAADCAVRDFAVSAREASAIRSHMWPLTLFNMPDNRPGWIIVFADKWCSVQETIRNRCY